MQAGSYSYGKEEQQIGFLDLKKILICNTASSDWHVFTTPIKIFFSSKGELWEANSSPPLSKLHP